jgi:hypothetical protein
MAIPLAPAGVAVISVVGVGIFKVVEGDHDRAFFLDLSSPTPLLPPPPELPRLDLSSVHTAYPIVASDPTGVSSGQSTILITRHPTKPNGYSSITTTAKICIPS